ncbi:hypothetical protein FIU83_09625 [Halomonas sp. THAF5a]|uniref:hypothetical protein n=1 Tax=Halomonas sp. THAF5a TaxID=2587844 RepID=UPI0012AA73D4|nr:hypothetical protein [Halomonas sp. THAF5a]QFU01900.1 hypothetical protein FIU83_09625 [Halomonas sp. THAF5a]
MKQQNSRQPVDEREKLRQFRELDDAFAEALRSLDAAGSGSGPASGARGGDATGATEGRQDATGAPQDAAARQRLFEERLTALMREYAQPADHVSRLLETMRSLGRIA